MVDQSLITTVSCTVATDRLADSAARRLRKQRNHTSMPPWAAGYFFNFFRSVSQLTAFLSRQSLFGVRTCGQEEQYSPERCPKRAQPPQNNNPRGPIKHIYRHATEQTQHHTNRHRHRCHSPPSLPSPPPPLPLLLPAVYSPAKGGRSDAGLLFS